MRTDALRAALAAEDTSDNAVLYLLLRAADRFHATYQRYPGAYDRRVGCGAGCEAGCCGAGGCMDGAGARCGSIRGEAGVGQAWCRPSAC